MPLRPPAPGIGGGWGGGARRGPRGTTELGLTLGQLVEQSLVQIAHRTRNLKGHGLDEGISTRLLVYAGGMISEGIEPAAACQMTLVTPLTDDPDMRETLEAAVATFFVS